LGQEGDAMTDTVRVWMTDQGLRIDRMAGETVFRALVWPRPGGFTAFWGQFEPSVGASPGELGWLLTGVESTRTKTMDAAVRWVMEGTDAPPSLG